MTQEEQAEALRALAKRYDEAVAQLKGLRADLVRRQEDARNFKLVVAALVVAALVACWFAWSDRQQVVARQRESVATDRAFCALANDNRSEINRNRETLRQAFALVVPPPGAAPEERERLTNFRARILATINGDLVLLNCDGIGKSGVDFSILDAIREAQDSRPTTTSPTTTTTGGTP